MVLLSARIRIIHSLLCCITVISLNAAEIIKGDEYTPEGITYLFPVNKIVKDIKDDALFIGARDPGAGLFALSGLHPTVNRVQPLTPKKVTLNNTPGQDNPLYDQGVALLGLMEATDARRYPIVVTNNDLTRVHIMKEFFMFDNMSVYSTQQLIDANMQVTNQIVGLVGFAGGARSAAIAAINPNAPGSFFGDTGSAFTTLTFQQFDEKVPATEGKPESIKITFQFAQFRLTPFDRLTEDEIRIGSPVSSIANNVVMEWSRSIQRDYIGLQVLATTGARSILLMQVDDTGAMILRKFAPDSAFDAAGDQIIGGLGAIPLSIHAIANMDTSTGLSYLIVQGGNGTPDQTVGDIYALPIINARDRSGAVVEPTIHGTLASKNAEVFSFYDGFQPSRLLRKRFIQPATTPAETPRANDPAVKVGGGPITQGTIQAINVVYDAVMVSVSEEGSYGPCATGMYISRALYDDIGVIKAWTPWERIGGTAESVFHSELSIDSGNITYFTGDNAASVNTIKRTAWGFGSNPGLREFAEQINNIYVAGNGGVQGLVDVPFDTPGLNGISLMVATGYGAVTLTETGIKDTAYADIECPNMNGYAANARVFENGTISETLSGSIRMLTIEGGALDVIGPVVTAAIGVKTSTNQGYLFVGGSRGLAVLAKPNGDGWDTAIGLGPNFAGLTNGMAFKILNDYTFVRNLMVDGNFLYVVSASRIDRIDLSTAPLFTATTIASKSSLVFDKNDTILDGLFSSKLGLLATTKGMFRTSNGNDVSSITTDENKYWTNVAIPSGIVPPQEFMASSTTGRATDVARNHGGMIHILSAYLGSNRARLNRFSIKDVSTVPIDDTTVSPLSDGDTEGIISSFLVFDGYRSFFTTDGALTLHTIGRFLRVSPYVKTRFFRNGSPAPLDNSNGTLIQRVLRSSASGSWLVAGDFGIRINE